MAFKLIAVVLMVCIFGAKARMLSFKNCDSSAPIQVGPVNLKSSYPIVIKPGEKISASGSYTNNFQATSQTVFRLVNVKVERKVGWWYVSVTRLIQSKIPKTVKCVDVQALSPIPLCPGLQGSQRFDASFTVPSTLNLGSIAGLIGSGSYKVSVDVRDDATGRRVVCVKDAEAKIKL